MRYIILVIIFFIATCTPQEPPRVKRFEPWDVKMGMCSGYLGHEQYLGHRHIQLVKYGLRSQTYIFKGLR
jgi:hypothetical protein